MDSIKTSTESRGRGPVVTEHKVDSRSRPGLKHSVRLYHGKDGAYLGGVCSCEAYTYSGKECRHIRLLVAPVYTITRVEVHDGYRRTSRYQIRDHRGRCEGVCISFADAYEAIVDELGGVLGDAGTGGYHGLGAA